MPRLIAWRIERDRQARHPMGRSDGTALRIARIPPLHNLVRALAHGQPPYRRSPRRYAVVQTGIFAGNLVEKGRRVPGRSTYGVPSAAFSGNGIGTHRTHGNYPRSKLSLTTRASAGRRSARPTGTASAELINLNDVRHDFALGSLPQPYRRKARRTRQGPRMRPSSNFSLGDIIAVPLIPFSPRGKVWRIDSSVALGRDSLKNASRDLLFRNV